VEGLRGSLMVMRNDIAKLVALVGVVLVGGCRFKGVESFKTATTPVNYAQERLMEHTKGDPYANGGIAYASAGSRLKTRYGIGANANSTEKVNPKLDQPAKGSGQQPGEEGGDAAPGYGKSNAPANQPLPSVDSASAH